MSRPTYLTDIECPKCKLHNAATEAKCWSCGTQLIQPKLDYVVPCPSCGKSDCILFEAGIVGESTEYTEYKCGSCGYEFKTRDGKPLPSR